VNPKDLISKSGLVLTLVKQSIFFALLLVHPGTIFPEHNIPETLNSPNLNLIILF